MAVDTLLGRLRRVALAMPRPGCDWEERPTFHPPATADQVESLQRAVKRALPPDWLDFVRAANGVEAMSVHNGYHLCGTDSAVQRSTSTRNPSPGRSDSLVIAWDGGGNAFLISPSGGIDRWEHETDELWPVAASFADFLGRVADDWEAYLNDTPGWKYLV